MVSTSSPGKIILFGEHSVVYNKLGIATAINRKTRVKVEKNKNQFFEFYQKFPNFEYYFKRTKDEIDKILDKFEKNFKEKDWASMKELSFDDALVVVFGHLIKKYGYEDIYVTAEQEGSLKGLGGSASTFAALALAYKKFRGYDNQDRKEISDFALKGDIVAHAGTPSGIDNSTVTYGGYITFQKSKGLTPLETGLKMNIIIVNSGEPAATAETVAYVRKQREEDPEKIDKIMDNLDKIANDALDAIKNKDSETVGKLMYDFYEELKKTNISTPKLEKIIKIAKDNNVLGAKPTGGWGGGNCIVLVKDDKEAEKIINIYKENGFDAFKTTVGVEGVIVE